MAVRICFAMFLANPERIAEVLSEWFPCPVVFQLKIESSLSSLLLIINTLRGKAMNEKYDILIKGASVLMWLAIILSKGMWGSLTVKSLPFCGRRSRRQPGRSSMDPGLVVSPGVHRLHTPMTTFT